MSFILLFADEDTGPERFGHLPKATRPRQGRGRAGPGGLTLEPTRSSTVKTFLYINSFRSAFAQGGTYEVRG